MLLTNWRIVPLMALASRDSLAGSKLSLPSLLDTFTSAFCASDRAPPVPLTEIWSSFTDTSTPAGMVTGIFPTRDISVSPQCRGLGHIAQHFATDTGSTRFAIGHNALGGGDNGHTQTVHDLWDGITAFVHTQARTADALDTLDDRTSGVVLQGDFDFRLAAFGLDLESVNVTLVLQDLGDSHLHFGSGYHDRGLGDHLGIADAGQQVSDGITHAHV